MDTENEPAGGPTLETPAKPKKPRKPAAKKAVKSKPKAKKKPAKKASKPLVRMERVDLRLSKKEKAKLVAKAKATRRTVTSIIMELIEKMK